jgi:DNA-binding transcriptional ArsR family regulator
MKQKERILLSLSKLEILNRNMISRLLNVGIRRVNVLMGELYQEGLIKRVEGLNGRIYKLSKRGAELMGVEYLHGWSLVNHRIMRNWILLHEPRCRIETQIRIGDISLTPDAIIQSTVWKFVEVDRTQKWKANIDKLERYAALKEKGAFQKKYGHFPTLIWIVEIESRKPKIKEACRALNLHCEVYTKGEIQ